MTYQVVGYQPVLMRLALIDGQDFTHEFPVTGEPLPPGSVVALELLNRDKTYTYGSWPLTETETGWVAFIEAADHAVVPHGGSFRLSVTYPGEGRFYWIAGSVERNRR